MCAKLGVALIHARPYSPEGKGKMERWFRTLRAQLLTRLRPEDLASLEALNRRLWAWIEGEYHHAPHRGLDGRTPLECWTEQGEQVRFTEPGLDLDDLFLFEVKRRVLKDRTVSLDGTAYEVDAVLVGQTVTLRHDPAAPPGRPVQVWHQNQPHGLAKPVDLRANCFVKRQRPSHTPTEAAPTEAAPTEAAPTGAVPTGAAPSPAPGLRLRDLPDPDDTQENS